MRLTWAAPAWPTSSFVSCSRQSLGTCRVASVSAYPFARGSRRCEPRELLRYPLYFHKLQACLQHSDDPSISPPTLQRISIWKIVDILTNLFPLWVSTGALLAFMQPSLLTWFKGGFIEGTLAGIMMGMGLTVKEEDFYAVLDRFGLVVFGAVAQYTVMPLLGLFITKILVLPQDIAVGVILVSVCPGGTASNLVCLLAGANVSLSVLMTLTTTLACVFMTPMLMKVLAGRIVPVNALGLFVSALKVVLIPLLLGYFLRKKTPRLVYKANRVLPFVSVIGVTLVCASIVANNAVALGSCGLWALFATGLLHTGGYLLGYLIPRMAKLGSKSCRTISIEVGLQNAGLGAALAHAHFGSPLTAIPCAISATLSSIFGSALAGFWRWEDSRKH